MREAPRYHRRLLDSARRWIDDGEFGVAIIVCHTACEILNASVIRRLLERRRADWLAEARILPRHYDLADRRVRAVYTALTRDRIQDHPFWPEFRQHARRWNDVVHTSYRASKEDAEQSLAAVRAVVKHLEGL